jgi:hypothetical protein
MDKNTILEIILNNLTDQRSLLVKELTKINFNETNYSEKKSTIEIAISNLDMQIQYRCNEIESSN